MRAPGQVFDRARLLSLRASAMARNEFGERLPASLVLLGWPKVGPAGNFASVGMKHAFGAGRL
jgi:hypothetical protein